MSFLLAEVLQTSGQDEVGRQGLETLYSNEATRTNTEAESTRQPQEPGMLAVPWHIPKSLARGSRRMDELNVAISSEEKKPEEAPGGQVRQPACRRPGAEHPAPAAWASTGRSLHKTPEGSPPIHAPHPLSTHPHHLDLRSGGSHPHSY